MSLLHSPARQPATSDEREDQIIIDDSLTENVAANVGGNSNTTTEHIVAIAKPQLPVFIKDKPEIWFILV